MTARFVSREEAAARFRGRTVAIVGSGPGCLDNSPGFVDSHDIVVRVNNHKTSELTGFRTDVHYSFYGGSIRKTANELRAEGVTLCLCKCPDARALESKWHERNGKQNGIDFRYIYKARRDWWFCDTYVPTTAEFLASFELLDRHIPSTGFSALLLISSFAPARTYLTGFDFFASRVHNVDETWRPGNPDDPIGHFPEAERRWLARNVKGITMDARLTKIMEDL